MTDKQLDILVNIIGGVESGGQVYGNRRYDAYAPAYKNSPEEYTCTLGWCQFYGNNARELCQRIFNESKELFRKNNTVNIEKRLSQDWVAIKWNPSASEKSALLKIITTDVGKKVQDEMFKEDMQAFIKDAETFGISDVGAQMMYCEIRHLGGKSPVERIFNRANRPYTADTVYASLLLDQNDTSNNNQVGDKKYQSRHQKCVEWIHTYVYNTSESTFANEKEGENMFYDKYINSAGTHYISNSGSDENGKYYNGTAGDQTGNEWCLRSWYNRPWNCVLRYPDETIRLKLAELACAAALNDVIGYDQYQRDTYWTQLQKVNYDPSKITVKCESDCSAGVIANTKAVGYLLGISALKNISATYTGNMKTGFKAAGFTVLTDSKYLNGTEYLLPGDILLNEKSHTATNITKGSKAVSTSSTTSSSTITTTTNTTSSSVILKLGSTGSAVKTLQTLLNKLGCGLVVDGEFGSKTDAAVRKFQSANDLVVDGEYGPLSKAKLEALCAEKDTQASTSTKAYGTADKADIALAGTYQTTTALNMRYKAAVLTSDNVVCVLPQGAKVQCYKYYTVANGVKWLYVAYGNKVGFVSKEYLKKIN